MDSLITQIKDLQQTDISKVIDKRLDEFLDLGKKDNKNWFSELCFCLLTANSRAKTAINIQKELRKVKIFVPLGYLFTCRGYFSERRSYQTP